MRKDIAVVTTYYNPCRFKRRKENYDRFMAHMRDSKVKVVTVECVFGDEQPELAANDGVIHLSSNSLLWQKERLLNLAVGSLPPSYRYVAWLDCDIIFDNPHWVRDTVSALQRHPIAQLFETCIRLERDGNVGREPDVAESFASVMNKFPESMSYARYDLHGHTGYAWAMRREIFDAVGLYEFAISGSADHFMSHAIFGNYNFCIQTALKHDDCQISHLKAWGEKFIAFMDGTIGVVPGQIRHLWHGDLKHRNYYQRMHQITDLGYNPYSDVVADPGRPLEWVDNLNKPGLVAYFTHFFTSRKEDGDDSCPAPSLSQSNHCAHLACAGRHAVELI